MTTTQSVDAGSGSPHRASREPAELHGALSQCLPGHIPASARATKVRDVLEYEGAGCGVRRVRPFFAGVRISRLDSPMRGK